MKHLTAYNERRLQYSLGGAAAVPDPDASGLVSLPQHEVANIDNSLRSFRIPQQPNYRMHGMCQILSEYLASVHDIYYRPDPTEATVLWLRNRHPVSQSFDMRQRT